MNGYGSEMDAGPPFSGKPLDTNMVFCCTEKLCGGTDTAPQDAHPLYRLSTASKQKISHSPELCGRTPTPVVIPLQLFSLTPILGHPLHQPSDLRVTHAKRHSPDPHKSDHHHRFSQRSHLWSAPGRWQSVCRMRARLCPGPGLSTGTQGDLSWRW